MFGTVFKLPKLTAAYTLTLYSFSDGGGGQYEGREVYSRRLNLGVWSIGVANYAHQGGTKLSQGGECPPLPLPERNL